MRWVDCEDEEAESNKEQRGGEKARARARGTAESGRGGKRAQDARRRTEPGGE